MHAIRIHDLAPQGFLAFDLKEILNALGPRGLTASWTVGGVPSQGQGFSATGKGADEMEEFARSGARLSGRHLARMARNVVQVIWGEFTAFEDSFSAHPWVVLIAYDSSWWEVRSAEAALIDRVARAFRQVDRLGA
jgi:hypothetical protein